MRKLVESTFVTLDGVISDPGKWGQPYWDEDHSRYASELFYAADTMLLGRKTYENFVDAWPSREGDFADAFNAMPKYVASRTLRDATWNATVIQGDVAEAVAALKEQPREKNIIKYGTGELDRTLIEQGLVDEFHFWLFPYAAGSGDRLLDGITTTLELLDTTRFGSGIVVLKYGPKP